MRAALAALAALGSACAAAPPRTSALARVSTPRLADDLPLEPLAAAVEAQAALVERAGPAAFDFGGRRVPRARYAAGMRRFAALARAARTREELYAALAREFDFYRYAVAEDVLVTAYFEPVVDGAEARGGRFTQPLYRLPPDLPTPGPTRAEIDSGGALDGRGLELCWVDPLDAFVLQTEGSGAVALADGRRLELDYAGNNGRPHERLGRHLAAVLPVETMTMHTIEAYLRGLPEAQMRRWLEKNPRYVFFAPRRTPGAKTSIGLAAVEGRTIATDRRHAPKGALGFLSTTKPRFDGPDALAPAGWEPLERFVLDQDTGSGIVGARVDLFWGGGGEAGRHAGVMKQRGQLYYLVPR